jgi:hypothetical protein
VTKITHIAGSRLQDAETVLRVVSEGGGTMLMKMYLAFETVRVNAAEWQDELVKHRETARLG